MLGANSQQKSERGRSLYVQEVESNNDIAMQLSTLTKQIQLLAAKHEQKGEACRICGNYGHRANVCAMSRDGYSVNEFEQ